jgi:hypothetical protein
MGSLFVRLGGFTIIALLAACSSGGGTKAAPGIGIGDGEIPGTNSDGSGSSGSSAAAGAAGAPSAPSVGGGSASSAGGGPTPGGDGSVPAGILTAGTWDDNRNFDLFVGYRAQTAPTLPGAPPFSEEEHRGAYALWGGTRAAKTALDVSLVIDTTGSMGDEMDYLRSEFLAMHDAIEAGYPGSAQRWSLVVYKDTVDEYIARWFDFRTDPNDFVMHMAAQTAGGGGDYPESPEIALGVAARLGWRGDDTAKLAFWVTDAPHHDKDAATMAQSIRALRDAGVHLYPVAASGADELTELTMREGAQLTGGRFLFLTDDSGVGDSHITPRVPCLYVTKLDKAILRMVDVELTGQYREPNAADVIRTGGDPQSGRCTLAGGTAATIF